MTRLRSLGLRARTTLVVSIAVAVAVIGVSVSAYVGTRSAVLGQIDRTLSSLDTQILAPAPGSGHSRNYGPGAHGGGNVADDGAVPPGDCDEGLGINRPGQPFGGPEVFVQLLRQDGSICRSTGEKATIPPTARAREIARRGRGRYFANQSVSGGRQIRVLVQGVPGLGALMLAQPLAAADSTLDHELLLIIVIAAVGILVAGLLGWLVARAAVAPITRFTASTERIARNVNELERERLQVEGSDELARLALTFNETLDALERSVNAQRNLVADASHELRTPIATLRANLQLLRDEARLPAEDREALRRDMIEELDELTNLVSDVVELARGTKAPDEAGDLRLEQIVTAALERARRRGPELSFEAELEPTLIRGEGERVARAISNLLDNAIKWSPPGGVVEVGLHDGVLSVRDHGPGFRASDLPYVFDRFHRARDARSKPGSGLGLAIVRQTAEAHGGFVIAANAPGGGALMRIGFGPPALREDEPAPERSTEQARIGGGDAVDSQLL